MNFSNLIETEDEVNLPFEKNDNKKNEILV